MKLTATPSGRAPGLVGRPPYSALAGRDNCRSKVGQKLQEPYFQAGIGCPEEVWLTLHQVSKSRSARPLAKERPRGPSSNCTIHSAGEALFSHMGAHDCSDHPCNRIGIASERNGSLNCITKIRALSDSNIAGAGNRDAYQDRSFNLSVLVGSLFIVINHSPEFMTRRLGILT